MLHLLLNYGLLSCVAFLIMWLFILWNVHKLNTKSLHGGRHYSMSFYIVMMIMLLLLHLLLTFLSIYFTYDGFGAMSILILNLGGVLPSLFFIAFVWIISDDSQYFHIGMSAILSFLAVCLLIGISALHTHFSPMTSFNSLNYSVSDTKDIPTMKKGETPVAISTETALSEMRKSMSDISNPQYYNLDSNVQAQYYRGKPVYVATIKFKSWTRANSANHQIPGYFMLDATDPDASPKFVRKNMVYTPSSYFNKNVDRLLSLKFPDYTTISNNAQLEIDNDGTPYFVKTLMRPKMFNVNDNYKSIRIAVINAETGKSNLYTKSNLPSFIDEAYTSDVAASMNKVYAQYNHGFWNQFWGWSPHTGVVKPSENGSEDGLTTMFNKDGSISYIEDYTTSDSSKSAIGYSTTNARTGKLTYYNLQNSTVMDSDSAIDNANENYRTQHWSAQMPVLYKIYGHPTWVMSILDKTNTLRGYYYLDASNQNLYANASSSQATLAAFRQALVSKNVDMGNQKALSNKDYQGTISRMAILNSGGKSMVEFMLQGSKTVFTVDPASYNKAGLLKPLDQVKFKASVTDGQVNGNITDLKVNY